LTVGAWNNIDMSEDRIGLRQAAEQLGVSKDTLWRAIRRDDLQAERDHGPSGTQFWLSWEKVQEWWDGRRDRKRLGEVPQAPEASEIIVGRVVMEFPSQAPQDTEELLAAPTVEVFSEHAAPAAPATVPAEVHLQALRLVERAQLQVESMRFELHSTRRALSEQAESLAEKDARVRQAELLKEENLRNQDLWQAEKAQLVSELTHHKERVNWLEKRVPRWVRGLFGAK
jgi:excisionase family DNA binding protein